MGGDHGQAGEVSRWLLARRYGELRVLVRNRDLRAGRRAGLPAERIPGAFRHRSGNAHLRFDRRIDSESELSQVPLTLPTSSVCLLDPDTSLVHLERGLARPGHDIVRDRVDYSEGVLARTKQKPRSRDYTGGRHILRRGRVPV